MFKSKGRELTNNVSLFLNASDREHVRLYEYFLFVVA